MVFKYGDSSDSEEERHDRFRNERSNTSQVKLSLNSFGDRSSSRSQVPSRPRLCALCDRPVSCCLCSKSDRRVSPSVTPHREQRAKETNSLEDRYYSRKRRSPTEERRSVKRRSIEKETRSEDNGDGSLKCKVESDMGSKSSRVEQSSNRDDPTSARHREKKCKKKMRKEKRKEEEEVRKKHSKNETSKTETSVSGAVHDVGADLQQRDMDCSHTRERWPDSSQTKRERHRPKLDLARVKSDHTTDKSVGSQPRGSESTNYTTEKHRSSTHSHNKIKRENSKESYRSGDLSSVDRIESKEFVDSDETKHCSHSDHGRDIQCSQSDSKERSDTTRSGLEDVDECRRKDFEGSALSNHNHNHMDSARESSNHPSHPPTLPAEKSDGEERHSSSGSDSASYGPTLPPLANPIGTSGKERNERDVCPESLPTEQRTSVQERDAASTSISGDSQHIYGPTLPPSEPDHRQSLTSTYGPQLPAQHTYGPTLPPSSSRSEGLQRVGGASLVEEEDDPLGPVPQGSSLTASQILLQHRANLLRIHSSHKVDKEQVKREEWMLELPDRHRSGLATVVAARSFKTKTSDAQIDSSWTDSPADKIRKKELAQMEGCHPKSDREELERVVSQKRDRHMEKLVKASNKKSSSKSLLQLHQDQLAKQNKKAKKEGKKEERRPFNRETDLSTTRLTQAQKQSIYKKAHDLDSRFSSGRAKYL